MAKERGRSCIAGKTQAIKLRSDMTEVTRLSNEMEIHVFLQETSWKKERAWKGDRGQRAMTMDSKTHSADGMEQKPTCLWYAEYNSGCNSFLQKDIHLRCHTDNSSHRTEALLLLLTPSTWRASQSSLKKLEDGKKRKTFKTMTEHIPKYTYTFSSNNFVSNTIKECLLNEWMVKF